MGSLDDEETWTLPALTEDPVRPGLARGSDPARPYRFTKEWAPLERLADLPIPPDAHPLDGCLKLSDLGCGTFLFVVVTGESAGQVWIADSDGGGSIRPVSPSFAACYSEWLDEVTVEGAVTRAREEVRSSPNSDEDIIAALPLARTRLDGAHDSIGRLDSLAGSHPRLRRRRGD